MKILDIHTHGNAPKPEAVIALGLAQLRAGVELAEDQAYSVGIHPWETLEDVADSDWQLVERFAERPEVVAIGECGVEVSPKAGPMFRQLQVFRRHVELSERLAKPMVLHAVKADDIIVGLRRDLAPKQPWCIHGFRRKPGVAQMLLRAGCYLSFGELFNEDSLRFMADNAPDRILAETDESPLPITRIIARLNNAAGKTVDIQTNTTKFLLSNR